MFVELVMGGLASLTVVGQILVALVIVLSVLSFFGLKRMARFKQTFLRRIEDHAALFSLIVAIIASGGSLFLQYVAYYVPCELCWYQRIFMYPQVFLFGLDLFRKRTTAFVYALPLSVIGLLISGYHYGLQMFALATPGFSDACSATGVSCASTDLLQFGYITIPLMAFTAFALILGISMIVLRRSEK